MATKRFICTCKICGREFPSATTRSHLCSPECRLASRRANSRAYLERHAGEPKPKHRRERDPQRALRAYLRQRVKVLDQLGITYPADIMDREFTSEIQIDNYMRSLITK